MSEGKKRINFIALLVFVLSTSFAMAQNTGTIHGKITDSLNEPIEMVGVSVFGSSQAQVLTDKNGEYTYTIPADKEVIVVFSEIGHHQKQETVKVAAGEKKELNVSLDLNQFKIIEVTDNKERFKEGIRIDPLILNHIPGPSGDFNEFLFTLPGVASRNELSSTYSVRGGNFDENLVYVNGIEVYRPFLIRSGQQEGLSFVNGDLVSSVVFSAGGFEAKYGDKMSSVLDVQYRKPRAFAGTVSGSLLGFSFISVSTRVLRME